MPSCSPDPNDIVIHFVNDDDFDSIFGLNPRPAPHCEGDEQSAECQGESPAARCPNFDNQMMGDFPFDGKWGDDVGPNQGWPVHYNRQYKFPACNTSTMPGEASASDIYIGLVAGDENNGREMTEYAEAKSRESEAKRVDGMLFRAPVERAGCWHCEGCCGNDIGPGTIPRRDLSFRPCYGYNNEPFSCGQDFSGDPEAAAQEIAGVAQGIINTYASTGTKFYINLVLDDSGSMRMTMNWGPEATYRAALEALTIPTGAELTVEVQASSTEAYEQWAVEDFNAGHSPSPTTCQPDMCFPSCDFSDSANLDRIGFSKGFRCSPSTSCLPNNDPDRYTNCTDIDCGGDVIWSGTTSDPQQVVSCIPCVIKPLPTRTHTIVMFIYSAFDNTCCLPWDAPDGFYLQVVRKFMDENGPNIRTNGYGDLAVGTATPSDLSWNLGPTCFGLGDGNFGVTECCKKIWPMWLWDTFEFPPTHSYDGFFPSAVSPNDGCGGVSIFLPENSWFDTYRTAGCESASANWDSGKRATHFRQHWYAPIEFPTSGDANTLLQYFMEILEDRKNQVAAQGNFDNEKGLRVAPTFNSAGYPEDIWNVVLVVRNDMFTHDLSEDAKRYKNKCGGDFPVQGYPYSWDAGGMCVEDISEPYNSFKESLRQYFPHFNIIEAFWQLPHYSHMNQIIEEACGLSGVPVHPPSPAPGLQDAREAFGCTVGVSSHDWWSSASKSNLITKGYPMAIEPWHISNISHRNHPGYTNIQDLSCSIECSPVTEANPVVPSADPTPAHDEAHSMALVDHCECQFFHVIFSGESTMFVEDRNDYCPSPPTEWRDVYDFDDRYAHYSNKINMELLLPCYTERGHGHWSGIAIEQCSWQGSWAGPTTCYPWPWHGNEAGQTIIGNNRAISYLNGWFGSWTEKTLPYDCQHLAYSPQLGTQYTPETWVSDITSAIESQGTLNTNLPFCVYIHDATFAHNQMWENLDYGEPFGMPPPTHMDDDVLLYILAELHNQFPTARLHATKLDTQGDGVGNNLFSISNVLNSGIGCFPAGENSDFFADWPSDLSLEEDLDFPAEP